MKKPKIPIPSHGPEISKAAVKMTKKTAKAQVKIAKKGK